MNYIEMSDFEINCAVARALNFIELTQCQYGSRKKVCFEYENEPKDVSEGFSSQPCDFNPCNSWADAGPIIEKENISLTCHQSRDEWAAIFNRHAMAAHRNPLRAAMECYLMKKERGNAA